MSRVVRHWSDTFNMASRWAAVDRVLWHVKLLAPPRAGAAERASASARAFSPKDARGKVSSRDRRLASSSTVRVHRGLVQRQPRRSFAKRWRSAPVRVVISPFIPQGQCLFYRTIVPLRRSLWHRASVCSCKLYSRVPCPLGRRCFLPRDTDAITWLPDVACPATTRRDVNTVCATDRLILETIENARDNIEIRSRALRQFSSGRASRGSCDRAGKKEEEEKLQATFVATVDSVETSNDRKYLALAKTKYLWDCQSRFVIFFFFAPVRSLTWQLTRAVSGCHDTVTSRCFVFFFQTSTPCIFFHQ